MDEELFEDFDSIKTPTPFNYTGGASSPGPSHSGGSGGSSGGSSSGSHGGSYGGSSGGSHHNGNYYGGFQSHHQSSGLYPRRWYDPFDFGRWDWNWFGPRETVIVQQPYRRRDRRPMPAETQPMDYTNIIVVILLAAILMYLVHSRRN
jgi:hypothetical protein